MEGIKFTKKDFKILCILFIICSVFTILWLAFFGNKPQLYTDIIIEFTAFVRSNKSAEILLLRLLIIFGSLVIFLSYFFKHRNVNITSINDEIIEESSLLLICIFSVIFLKFTLFQQITQVFLFALCFAAITFVFDKDLVVSTVCHYFLNYYVCLAIYQIFNFFQSYFFINCLNILPNYSSIITTIFSIIVTGIPFVFTNKEVIQKKMILLSQFFIPALFLILSIRDYFYKDQIIIVGIPIQAKLFIGFSCILCFFNILILVKKNWSKDNCNISEIISIGTCITIMCYNNYHGQGSVVSTDFHHPFENIFAFQQIFELKQIPFIDFLPPSGLYSVIQGAFFKLFGNGNIAYYSLCENIFYCTLIAITLILLRFHVNNIWCFYITVFYNIFSNYNRVVFIPIVILLLLLPPLVKRPNLWVKVFLLISVFHGLYYPLYGVACFVGFIPMLIIQVRKIIVEKDTNRNKKSIIFFYLSWFITFLILLVSVPLLWGMFIHMLNMSGQSLLADGISIFGQELPNNFMHYANDFIRYSLYTILRIVPLALLIWIPVLLLLKMNNKIRNVVFISDNIEPITFLLIMIFLPIISYTFTFIRVDIFTMYSRSYHIMAGVFILYLIFTKKYLLHNKFSLLLLIIIIFFNITSNGIGIDSSEGKFFTKYYVPNDYTYVDDFEYDTVNKAFIQNDNLNLINYYEKTKISGIKGEPSLESMLYFGYYYVLKQKGGAHVETVTIFGYGAAKEAKKMLEKNKIITGGISGTKNYYLYNYLLSSGKYIWDSERQAFVPYDGIKDFSIIKEKNSKSPYIYENFDWNVYASDFGLSMKSLKKILTEKKIGFTKLQSINEVTINLKKPEHGKDIDFLYIEFDKIKNDHIYTDYNWTREHEKKQTALISKLFLKLKPNPDMTISIGFYDENGQKHRIDAWYGDGKLLFNLGLGSKYLLEAHDKFEITVYKNGVPVEIPEIKEIKFFKCRQIYNDEFNYTTEM